jgi:hypothetical protein
MAKKYLERNVNQVITWSRNQVKYYDIGQFGHVAIAIGKRTNSSCLSNDYVRKGMIDACSRDFPRWGVKYLGHSAWTPYGSLRLD